MLEYIGRKPYMLNKLHPGQQGSPGLADGPLTLSGVEIHHINCWVGKTPRGHCFSGEAAQSITIFQKNWERHPKSIADSSSKGFLVSKSGTRDRRHLPATRTAACPSSSLTPYAPTSHPSIWRGKGKPRVLRNPRGPRNSTPRTRASTPRTCWTPKMVPPPSRQGRARVCDR